MHDITFFLGKQVFYETDYCTIIPESYENLIKELNPNLEAKYCFSYGYGFLTIFLPNDKLFGIKIDLENHTVSMAYPISFNNLQILNKYLNNEN